MVNALDFVHQAWSGNYLGIPYSELDCQAFVERVLKDCGEKHDWRGSNDMWRNALSSKGKIESYSEIPAGAWLFNVQHDGGEKDRGYNDNEGNAKHVGIYLGNNNVIHSTTGGVQMDVITSKRWNSYGLCKYIDYDNVSMKEFFDKLRTMTLDDLLQGIRQYWG